jgi:L-aspartate oxidase
VPHRPAYDVHDGGTVVIVGGGLAGLFTALKLAPLPVTLLTPAPLGKGAASAWAQGGIAAALGEGDTPEDHARDTIAAGAGLVDPDIAHLIAREANTRIADLMALGVPFDRDSLGRFSMGREAAHSHPRIVRVTGDRAGAAVMGALTRAVQTLPSITVVEGFTATELLLLPDGAVAGVAGIIGGQIAAFRAPHTILAMGGLGALFAVTTNPPGVRGEGMALAARAGAVIADPEFVQFHPTALDVGHDPAPLATEALRGEGATLINGEGERFMPRYHAEAELGPRDVVARAIQVEIAATGRVYLDAREAVGAAFPDRFPTVHAACVKHGIDPVKEPIPVAPAAHYHMGGVRVDEWGRTTLDRLYACGETAATGAHGANRLASNSLLEALVFGARIAEAIAAMPHDNPPAPVLPPLSAALPDGALLRDLRRTMTDDVGLVRSAESLMRALDIIDGLERAAPGAVVLRNMTVAAKLVAHAALAREESRGGHYRLDFPVMDPRWQRRTFLTLADIENGFSAREASL